MNNLNIFRNLLIVALFITSNISWAQNFIKYSQNPVIDTLTTVDSSQMWTRWKTDPYVIQWGKDDLRMYYGANNYGVETQIGTAFSSDGNNWIEKRDTPVLPVGPIGSWDAFDVETPAVIYVPSNPDSMKYMLYYSGSTADSILLDTINPVFYTEEIYQMGMAYSQDGINFTKYNDPTNDTNLLYANSDPVLKIPSVSGGFPDTINCFFASIAEPSPMYDTIDNIFKMWYIGLGCSNPACSGASNYRFRVLYSESSNGINWTSPIVTLDNGDSSDFDSKLVYAPHVIKIGKKYWMFYGGNTLSSGTFFLFSQQIGLAISDDGINFSKSSKNPVILKGLKNTWNNLGSNYPCSIIYHDSLRIYYSGLQDTILNFTPNIGYSILDSTLMSIVQEPPSGIKNSIDNNVILYPNPTNKFLSIETKNESITRIKIYDYTGKFYINKQISPPAKQIKLDTDAMLKGVYIIHIYGKKRIIQSQKLIID